MSYRDRAAEHTNAHDRQSGINSKSGRKEESSSSYAEW